MLPSTSERVKQIVLRPSLLSRMMMMMVTARHVGGLMYGTQKYHGIYKSLWLQTNSSGWFVLKIERVLIGYLHHTVNERACLCEATASMLPPCRSKTLPCGGRSIDRRCQTFYLKTDV